MTIAQKLKTAAQSLALAFGMATASTEAPAETNTDAYTQTPREVIQPDGSKITILGTYFFVKLDNRWYDVEIVDNYAAKILPYMGLVVPGALMQQCAEGVWGGPFGFWYGQNINPVYDVTRFNYGVYHVGQAPVFVAIAVMDVGTLRGNVQCIGEVPSPFADRIFRNGFEAAATATAPAPTPDKEVLSLKLDRIPTVEKPTFELTLKR